MTDDQPPADTPTPDPRVGFPDRTLVGVLAQRRKLDNPWASHAWAPSAVVTAPLPLQPWTRLAGDERVETFYAGTSELRLYPGETAHYRDNLVSGRPSLWVSLRPVGVDDQELGTVTADPYEGESMVENMGNTVEAVPMPAEIALWVEAFIAAFHVERPFFKRQRDRVDPNQLGHRRRTGEER